MSGWIILFFNYFKKLYLSKIYVKLIISALNVKYFQYLRLDWNLIFKLVGLTRPLGKYRCCTIFFYLFLLLVISISPRSFLHFFYKWQSLLLARSRLSRSFSRVRTGPASRSEHVRAPTVASITPAARFEVWAHQTFSHTAGPLFLLTCLL